MSCRADEMQDERREELEVQVEFLLFCNFHFEHKMGAKKERPF
jgi:hypothetical protein